MRLRIAIFILLVFPTLLSAQQNTDTAQQAPPPRVAQFRPPVFRGLSVHADIAAPVIGAITHKAVDLEFQVDVNLYRRIFPIFEAGFTSVNHRSDNMASYGTASPFFRVGLNYGLLKPFKDNGNPRDVRCYPFAGLRYAFSPMNYKIDGMVVNDPYWGNEQTVAFSKPLVYTGWLEVVAGVRVDLYKGLTMGWSVRLKTLMHTTAPDKSHLWYVPGFGRSSDAAFSLNYTIGYTFYSGDEKKAPTPKPEP